MRKINLSTATVVVFAILAALAVAPFLLTWMVVDIQSPSPDRVHLKIPIPLGLVRVGVAFAPRHRLTAELPERAAEQRELIARAVAALRDAPDDTTFVTVTSPRESVRVSKVAGRLLVDVEGRDGTVHAKVPVEALRRLLDRWDGRSIHPRMALDFLSACGRGELVAIDGRDARVRVTIW